MESKAGVTRIVIVGGGFAGVYTARGLGRIWGNDPSVEVALISKVNYFLMTPLLFEAGSGVLDPRHAVSPIRRMIDHVRFVMATVEEINLETKNVRARSAQEGLDIEFDHLVLALGGVTNTKIIPGSESARTFKTLADAIAVRNGCIRVFEEADVERDAARKRALLTFVIVGAGLVGVELQGELTEFIENIRSIYPHVRREEIRFELIERGPRIMPELAEDLGEYAARTLAKRGVNVRVGAPVERMEPEKVHLKGGEVIESKTIILAAGVASHPLVAALAVEKDKHGRVVVEATMRCKSDPSLWALGDCAAIPNPEGKPYPQLAQHALREARLAAKNITAVIRGREAKPFIYQNKGTLAALGGHKGVGRIYKIKVYGFVAWWVWRTYYLLQMPHFQRKLRVVIDWTVALFFKNDVVELDVTRGQ